MKEPTKKAAGPPALDSATTGGNFLSRHSPAFPYVMVCLAALGVLFLVLLRQGQGVLVSLLIVLFGVLGVVGQVRLAPGIVVLLVAIVQIVYRLAGNGDWELAPAPPLSVSNVLLCAATLGYVAGHFRLQGLGRSIVPALRSPRDRRPRPGMPRPVAAIAPGEPGSFVALPLWALAAQIAWRWLAQPHNVLELSPRVLQLASCLFILVAALTVTAAFLNYWRRRRMTAAEAILLLQDGLWNETRGEQRWISRWQAWLRRKRKEQP